MSIKNKPTKKKSNMAQKMRANPGFKWWAVPPKKRAFITGVEITTKTS